MFVTRAGRHDKADLKEFIEARRGGELDLSEGTAMIAREGSIVGCIRLIEVEPGVLVYDDVLVAEGRDEAVAKPFAHYAEHGGPRHRDRAVLILRFRADRSRRGT